MTKLATSYAADEKGINVAGIPKIQEALDSYKSGVKSKIDITSTTAQLRAAIKGTNSEAMFNAATRELNTSVEELLTFVDNYKNYLTQLEASYQQHDSSVTYSFK